MERSWDDKERRWVARAELDALCGERLGDFALDGLWVAGALDGLRAPCVAVVGTRAPSDAGRRRARRLAEDLARAGVCVVSGLALGIDGAAHEGALAARAPTVGVLGGGHGHFFPPRHRELGVRIVEGGGAVVSPFAPDVVPQPWQFLARNAVIAALADAVVVVEAAARSGALNTAGHGADRGIPVLAIPGDVDRPKAAGCNALIRDGATLVRDADDVLAALPGPLARKVRGNRERSAAAERDAPERSAEAGVVLAPDADSPPVRRVLAVLRDGSCDAAALADRIDLPPALLFPLLTELELSGRIVSGADGYSIRPSSRTRD
ncbi:MAG TPA: DNA-processing protein DprA [Candidatus Elarobacter sp.]|nr:DNA-processing protein DprA [Dongiaceae bacterium]HZW52469.1 DNA-processing protein DprA [Candidatus Elarobacter sp.]